LTLFNPSVQNISNAETSTNTSESSFLPHAVQPRVTTRPLFSSSTPSPPLPSAEIAVVASQSLSPTTSAPPAASILSRPAASSDKLLHFSTFSTWGKGKRAPPLEKDLPTSLQHIISRVAAEPSPQVQAQALKNSSPAHVPTEAANVCALAPFFVMRQGAVATEAAQLTCPTQQQQQQQQWSDFPQTASIDQDLNACFGAVAETSPKRNMDTKSLPGVFRPRASKFAQKRSAASEWENTKSLQEEIAELNDLCSQVLTASYEEIELLSDSD